MSLAIDRKRFADILLRFLALDRKRFAETMLYETTEPTYIIWPRTSSVWDAQLDVGEFNLDKARALLVEAGYPFGFETTVQGSSASFPPILKYAEAFQADLARIGVKLTIQDLESSQATAVLQGGKFRGMFAHAHAFGDQDPALLFTAFPFRTDGNASRFTSDEYTTLVMEARREPSWDKRIALYRRIAALVNGEAFGLPIANQVYTFAQRKNVRDFAARSTGGAVAPMYEDIRVA